MAFFSDLVRVVAKTEGIDEMTVTGIGQYLRDEGLIKKSGRGRSAARMSSSDAANLLIAVNASQLAKEAALTVRKYRDLQVVGLTFRPEDTSNQSIHPNLLFEIMSTARKADRFLENLIDLSQPTETQSAVLERLFDFERKTHTLSVEFGGPIASLRVIIEDVNHIDSDSDHLSDFSKTIITFAEEHFIYLVDSEDAPDRQSITRITHKTLLAVGKSLSS